MAEAAKNPPPKIAQAIAKVFPPSPDGPARRQQMLREYDPEWARAFLTGTVSASCDYARMLAAVKCPVLFTHRFRWVDEETGTFLGLPDRQAARVRELIPGAGQPFVYKSFPEMGHLMHRVDPGLFGRTLTEWAATLPVESEMCPVNETSKPAPNGERR